jgi:CHAD domain-containing protein
MAEAQRAQSKTFLSMKSELRELSVSALLMPSHEAQEPPKSKLVEEENEKKLESPVGDTQATAPVAAAPDSLSVRRALTRLLRKRVKKFVALAPEVSADSSPKTVHDVRVWSRRLQQAVSTLFPKPRSGKVRRLRRTPRRIRRALGEWRNCDVLLEMVAKQQRHTRSESKRRAWALVRDYLMQKRSKEVVRAGKKLLREDLGNYAARAQRLLAQSPEEGAEILLKRLRDSVEGAWTEWQSALTRAQETRAVADLHAFRIATKVLRYRTELLYDLGYRDVKVQLKWLADLQEVLGVWHDRQVLHQAVAEALGRAEFLLHELQAARVLLAELEAARGRDARDIENIFRLALERPKHEQMESRSENPLTPHALPLT